MLDTKRRETLIMLCAEMIRSNSVTGSEAEIGLLLKERMAEFGFDDAYMDSLGNVIGLIKGTGGGKTVLLDGHIDTVGVSDQSLWSRPPFGGEIHEGKIYGRGAADMKCALAAMIAAAAFLGQDRRPAGDVYISGTAMEEVAEGVSLKFILEDVKPDIVIIGEATELNLNIGQRGRAEILLKTRGKSAHSSNPEVGVNAVKKMMNLLSRVHELPVSHNEKLGGGILELTDIISSPYPGASVLPELCTVTMDRRLLTGEDEEAVLGAIRAVIDSLAAADPDFDAEVSIASERLKYFTGKTFTHSKFAPAWYMDEESCGGIIESAMTALRKAGLNPKKSVYKFCTNGSASAGLLGIPTIGFGPCAEWQAHVVDENCSLDELCKAAEGYYHLIGAMTNRQ